MIKRYTEKQINELVKILKNDGVISVPTDTVYGICARMNSIKAYQKLLKVKNRPKTKLFPIMCANKEQIKQIAIVDNKIEKIIDKFMPGPITIILKKNKNIPEYVTNGEKTIAIRMATSKILETLINEIESPIFITSANQSGETTCNNLDEIEENCPLLDGILEGKILFNQASTIVDLTSNEIKILRNGPISIENYVS